MASVTGLPAVSTRMVVTLPHSISRSVPWTRWMSSAGSMNGFQSDCWCGMRVAASCKCPEASRANWTPGAVSARSTKTPLTHVLGSADSARCRAARQQRNRPGDCRFGLLQRISSRDDGSRTGLRWRLRGSPLYRQSTLWRGIRRLHHVARGYERHRIGWPACVCHASVASRADQFDGSLADRVTRKHP